MRISNPRKPALHPESDLEKRLDALACGTCTEHEFICDALDGHDSDLALPLNFARPAVGERRVLDDRDDPVTADRSDCATVELFPTSDAASSHADSSADSIEVSIDLLPSSSDLPQQFAPLAEPPAVPLGWSLGNRYCVEALLGRGGRADVFKASDAMALGSAEADRLIAVKVLRKRTDQRPDLVVKLRHEFDCMRKLMHTNVVKVYEFQQDDSIAFYTMELLDAECLSDVIKRAQHQALPRAYAWAIVRAVGAALAHAHSRNVVHGDLSPRNVMITRNGEVRVLDLGSSTTSSEAASAIAATPAYACCELLEGHQADPRADIYSLACIACELLGGEHPFQGRRATEARALGMRPQRPRGVRLSQWRMLQRGLSWSRDERPLTIHQWLVSLGLGPEPERLPPLDAPLRSERGRPHSRLAISALSIAALLCLVFVWSEFHRQRGHPGAGAMETARVELPAALPAVPSSPADPPAAAGPEANPPTSMNSTASAVLQSARSRARRVGAPETKPPIIKFTAPRYAIRRGSGFAEIHLWRSAPSNELNSFVWWTENSSARAGIDFVAQNRATYSFAHQGHFATIFIRLLPNVVRAQRASFQVCAGKPNGAELVQITCSAVELPAYQG